MEVSRKILVVDDEELVRQLAQAILEDQGYQVVLATNGLEAVEAFTKESETITAVLLDLSMPGLSGEEVLRQLQNLRPSVPVVLSSGYDQDDVVTSIGAHTAFLRKPYSPADLIKSLDSVI